MINKNFEYYIGTTETAYVEDNITRKALDEYKKEFGVPLLTVHKEFMRHRYGGKVEPVDLYADWLLTTIHNEIFSNRAFFTDDFNVIDTPVDISETDALKLIEILRRASINYGLVIRRLSSTSFSTQWKKQYLTTTNIRLKDIIGADQYRIQLRSAMQNEILKYIRPGLSNYTKDVWEIYYTYGLEDEERTDPSGKYGVKPSVYYALTKQKTDKEECFDELSL
ncbi:MAG: hypothetical protein E7310_03260 [Clostridiales bacterium]|nr:hypothetical protein [Clostridiales bacterium]